MNEEFKNKPRIDEEAMMALMVDGVRLKGFTETELNAPGIRDEQYAPEQVHLVRSNYSSTLSRISFL